FPYTTLFRSAKGIVVSVEVPVQIGGGIRSQEDVRELIDAGAERVVIGSLAAQFPEKLAMLLDEFGARISVGIDAKAGELMVHGWTEAAKLSPVELARRVAALGGERIIYTDIARDGMLSGINVTETVAIAVASGLRVTASGGISSLEDIRKLIDAREPLVESVIVGKALYENRFTLEKAIKTEEVEKALASTIERFGKVDVVVNGAAGNFLCRPEDLSPNGFGTVVDIDLKGTFNVCRAAFEQLKEHRGQILNISATLHYLGTPMQLHVSAAKAGVDALTRNLAVEWGRHGIRVNAIAPGPIGDTEGMKRLVPEPIKEKLQQRIPLGRFGLIEDIENAAVFLCSDAANYINGAVLVVDGGHWLAANSLI